MSARMLLFFFIHHMRNHHQPSAMDAYLMENKYQCVSLCFCYLYILQFLQRYGRVDNMSLQYWVYFAQHFGAKI